MVEETRSTVSEPTVAKPLRVLVIDHHDSYVWNLVHLIAMATSQLPDLVQHDVGISVDGYTHVVLSPGPGHPDEYDWSVLDAGKPVLGVCLGMQAIVTHFGGQVRQCLPAHGEVAPIHHRGDGVLAGLPENFLAVRYHSLEAMPTRGLEVTASTHDGVVMAVRHPSLPIEGVQFHPESILSEHGALIVGNFLALS